MFREAVVVALDSWLPGLFATLVIGFLCGRYNRTWLWRILSWLAFVVVALGFMATSTTFSIYDLMYRSGQISAAQFDRFLLSLAFIVFVVFVVGEAFGEGLRMARAEIAQEAVKAVSVSDMLEGIELLLSTPAISVMPWSVNRWNKMSLEEKQAWVEHNVTDLKRFIAQSGGLDQVCDDEIIVELQRLDRHMQRS